jgi:molybdopterin molybdotransferase
MNQNTMAPRKTLITFERALELTRAVIQPLSFVELPLEACHGHILAAAIEAEVACPETDISKMDGYAVVSADIKGASLETPAVLKVAGTVFAGGDSETRLESGDAVGVLTGARIPKGADAVLANESVRHPDRLIAGHKTILATADVKPGANILPGGLDVAKGDCIIDKGALLGPGSIGLIAAAGWARIPVVPKPRIFILSIGDEVVLPGESLGPGQLYASNLLTLAAWCRQCGFCVSTAIVADREEAIRSAIKGAVASHDAIITSGGSWTSDRDLVSLSLVNLGWRKIYQGVRLRPGKGVGLGTLAHIPVFILPGGPSASMVAFLKLVLPGLHKLSGRKQTGLSCSSARLGATLTGKSSWTQTHFARFKKQAGEIFVYPIHERSRLKSIARAHSLITKPEGIQRIAAGKRISVQMLGEIPEHTT